MCHITSSASPSHADGIEPEAVKLSNASLPLVMSLTFSGLITLAKRFFTSGITHQPHPNIPIRMPTAQLDNKCDATSEVSRGRHHRIMLTPAPTQRSPPSTARS